MPIWITEMDIKNINSLTLGRFEWLVIYQLILVIDGRDISWEIAHRLMSLDLTDEWWLVNIGSDDGLVPPGNNPLPEPMLSHIYVTICHH